MPNKNLLNLTNSGLFCEAGNFFIDPWKPVDKAVITHAHSDHARFGSKKYLCSNECETLLRLRLGENISVQNLKYGEAIFINNVKVSLHPAGHILGSSQIRLEYKNNVWVITGDYKLAEDKTCRSFEQLKCNTFITESTFGLPIYKWENQKNIISEINNWWEKNSSAGLASILFCYALGKAQRLISLVDNSIGPILTHGSVENINKVYRRSGVNLPDTKYVGDIVDKNILNKSLIIAPPSAYNNGWLKKFGKYETAFASGWMLVRGRRRRANYDRGFVLSDHADWTELLTTIINTHAENIWVTHGYAAVVAKYFSEKGLNTKVIPTRFEGEIDDGD